MPPFSRSASKLALRTLMVGYWLSVSLLSARQPVDFNRDIRPILSGNCFHCHGPDEESREGGSIKTGGLRLDTFEGATMDIGGYSALVPGKPDESELFYLVTTEDEDDRMPPKKHGSPLSESEIAVLRQWIEEGGEYDLHWAYQKPIRPSLPDVAKSTFKLNNPIDHFVADKLVSKQLTQSPEADRYAQAKRVAMDLTGLPPTPDEVERFVNDPASKAYEQYVDQQLVKASYGEHWARMWLDLARYADSAGYADDPLRTIWGFRDYVIRSFNENKPFDEFTIEQLAGDLLQNPTVDQLVATAFHRNTKTNNEGGTDDEEFRNEAVVDRVNTTMAVWMGTTIDCAQCHTHKYDPISHEEYFKLFAIFNSTSDEDRTDEEPLLPIYTSSQTQERASALEQLQTLKSELIAALATNENKARRHRWEERLISGEGWQALNPTTSELTASSGANFSILEDASILVGENSAPRDTYTITTSSIPGMKTVSGIKLEVFPEAGSNTPWVLNEIEFKLVTAPSIEIDSETTEESEESPNTSKLKLANASASFAQDRYPASKAIDGNRGNRFSGWAAKGNLTETNTAVFELEEPITLPENTQLQIQQVHNFPNKKLKHFRLWLTDERKPLPALPKQLEATLTKKPSNRSQLEERTALEFFAQFDPASKVALEQISKAQAKIDSVKPLTTVPILAEVNDTDLRETHIQIRGSYLNKGRKVERGVPSIFHSLPNGLAPDRYGLARWLIDPDNPLTARVVVNRYWEALFGLGIVPTSEEFGSQGELPTNQALLDWLAVELMESDWNLKHLLKIIVTSATYRQSSKITPELYEADPDNRWLARGPRFRISAEMVRDQALAVSGLLSSKMYGPSVNPPQPALGLKAAFGGKTDWETSDGEDRYRRGIYTTWRRSNPYPSIAAFDAPNREVCTISRDRTNTPLQALVTLNDPVYIEASQALGRRILEQPGDIADKIAYGFKLCLSRPPSDKEVSALARLYESTYNRYLEDLEGARMMATQPIGPIPETGDGVAYAAWTVVGNTLLNLDEMFLKR
jgi:hypothetical protein